jgi:hypothetical protein
MRAALAPADLGAAVLVIALAATLAPLPARGECVTTTVAGATTARCTDGSRVTTTTVGGLTTNYYSDGSRSSDIVRRGSVIDDRLDTRTAVAPREPASVTTGGSTVLRSTYGGSGTRLP